MPHAPVAIMLTNLVSAECRPICREVGLEFFVDKSFGDEQLAGILKELAVASAVTVADAMRRQGMPKTKGLKAY